MAFYKMVKPALQAEVEEVSSRSDRNKILPYRKVGARILNMSLDLSFDLSFKANEREEQML